MDRKDEALKDLFRPMGTPSKAPSTALKDQFEKKDDKNKSKSWLNELGPMKFEPRVTPKGRTPEQKAEDEAMIKAREEEKYRRRQGKEGPSSFKKFVDGVVEMNAARYSGDPDRINKAYSKK